MVTPPQIVTTNSNLVDVGEDHMKLTLYNSINAAEEGSLDWIETELLDNDLSLHNQLCDSGISILSYTRTAEFVPNL